METETPEPTTQNVSDLPEWAQSLIKDTRSEAAKYRTDLRDLNKRFEDIESERDSVTAERDALQDAAAAHGAEVEGLKFERHRDQLAVDRGIPLNVAALVQETDEEQLITALDALAALKGTEQARPAPNPAQEAEPVNDEHAQKEAFARQLFQIDN